MCGTERNVKRNEKKRELRVDGEAAAGPPVTECRRKTNLHGRSEPSRVDASHTLASSMRTREFRHSAYAAPPVSHAQIRTGTASASAKSKSTQRFGDHNRHLTESHSRSERGEAEIETARHVCLEPAPAVRHVRVALALLARSIHLQLQRSVRVPNRTAIASMADKLELVFALVNPKQSNRPITCSN